jgi:hypothetical protein
MTPLAGPSFDLLLSSAIAGAKRAARRLGARRRR